MKNQHPPTLVVGVGKKSVILMRKTETLEEKYITMIKLLKIIIGAGSAGLATGIGTEIITNPAYSVAILDKVLGTGGKVILMLPLIGAIYVSLKDIGKPKPEETKKEKKIRGVKDATWSMVLMLLDLFYASIVCLKENIKGIILDKGWLKITKATAEKDKEDYMQELISEYPTTSSLYKDMNVNNYSTKLEIVEELERRLRIPIEKKGILDGLALSETTTGYLKVGLVVIGILGIVYIMMNKNKVYEYLTHLGETTLEMIKMQQDLAKSVAGLIQNDEHFAELMQKVQHEIVDCKATALSAGLVNELQEAIKLVSKNAEMIAKCGDRLSHLELDAAQGARILEEIINATNKVAAQTNT